MSIGLMAYARAVADTLEPSAAIMTMIRNMTNATLADGAVTRNFNDE